MAPSKKHLIAASMVMAAGVFGIISPAYADPTAPASGSAAPSSGATTSADVQKQIVAKQKELTDVNEEYLDAKLELENQTAAAEQAAANLAAAEQDLTTHKAMVADLGVQAYITGQLPTSALLIAGESPEEFIDKANSQAQIHAYNDQRITALAAAQDQTAALKAQVDAAHAAAQAAEKTIADKKAYIESELPKLEAQFATLSEQERAAVEAAAGGHANEEGQAAASSAGASTSATSATSATAPRPATAAAAPAPAPAQAAQGGSAAAMTVVNWAMSQQGKPYVWGGAGPNGYDCSGLTMAAYAKVGIKLPHSSGAQRGYGSSVSLSSLQPGDLVFAPGHVAIYIGNGTVVHAPTFGSPVRTMPMKYMSFNAARRLV